MTSYIARTGGQKKKNILRQKELELRGNIRREAAPEKLQRSAEKVRTAKLGVIKVLLEEVRPFKDDDEKESRKPIQKLQKAREYWEGISVDEIIQIYSKDQDKSTMVDRKNYWDFRAR